LAEKLSQNAYGTNGTSGSQAGKTEGRVRVVRNSFVDNVRVSDLCLGKKQLFVNVDYFQCYYGNAILVLPTGEVQYTERD
jgi:hypothetical protein